MTHRTSSRRAARAKTPRAALLLLSALATVTIGGGAVALKADQDLGHSYCSDAGDRFGGEPACMREWNNFGRRGVLRFYLRTCNTDAECEGAERMLAEG